ncbi:MAG: methyl-accepting chemotaxis protein [Candidatus Sericytochromatia bacterium]
MAFVVPIAILINLLITTSNVNIDFGQKEIYGDDYLKALRKIHEPLLIEKSLLQRNKIAGERNSLDSVQASIDAGFKALEDAEKNNGKAHGFAESGDLISAFKKHWDEAKGELAGMPAAKAMKTVDDLNTEFRTLFAHIGDKSNLILDPDLDTYYLMDAELLQVPSGGDNINKLQLLTEQMLAKHQVSEDEQIQLAVLSSAVATDVSDVRGDYDVAYREAPNFNKDAGLKDSIEPGWQAANKATQAYLAFVDRHLLKVKAGSVSGSMSQSANLAQAAYQKWFSMFDSLVVAEDKDITIRVNKLVGQRNFNLIWSSAVTLAVALLGVFVVLGIIRNINRVKEAAQAVTEGNLDAQAEVNTSDELGELAHSFNAMVESIRTSTQEIDEARKLSEGESLRLQSLFEEITNEVQNIKQSAEIVTDNARIVAETAAEASGISSDGESAVTESIQGVERIKEQIESVAGKILELSSQTQAIGNIISTVDDIAKQSKFLAFNASIEASKVGEYGKGFAIVANEIKNLSEESKEATKKIGEILSEIQGLTNTSVMLAEDATKLADSGFQLSTTAGETINKLTYSIQNSAEAAFQISSSALEQQSSLEQLVNTLQRSLASR